MVLIMKLGKFPESVRVNHTVKLFYRKYSYRACFKIDTSLIVESTISRNWYGSRRHSNVTQLRADLKRKIESKIPDGADFRLRCEHSVVSVYLNDETLFDDLVSKMRERLHEVTIPANESHKTVMNENHRIRVRERLFYDTFRFKVKIKNTWSERFNDFDGLKQFLDNLEVDQYNNTRWKANDPLRRVFLMTEEERSRPKYRYISSSFGVYLNDEQDVMMLQLWLNKHYDSAEKVVLISEL